MPANAPGRNGFTLIEVMVATTIAGMMMAVVMGLLAQLGHQMAVNKRIHQYQPWMNVFHHQLQLDFAHCRSIIVTETEIRLDGYFSCDPESGMTKRLPTYVVYRLSAESGQPGWLVRIEEKLTGDINNARTVVPVCYGVTGFQDMSDLSVDFPPGQWHLRLFLVDEQEESRSVDLVLHRHGGILQ